MKSFRNFTEVQPVPREVVDATPYDSHWPKEWVDNERAARKENPWAGSGHYGKELGLMLSGHKRVSLLQVPDFEYPHWKSHVKSGQLKLW